MLMMTQFEMSVPPKSLAVPMSGVSFFLLDQPKMLVFLSVSLSNHLQKVGISRNRRPTRTPVFLLSFLQGPGDSRQPPPHRNGRLRHPGIGAGCNKWRRVRPRPAALAPCAKRVGFRGFGGVGNPELQCPFCLEELVPINSSNKRKGVVGSLQK